MNSELFIARDRLGIKPLYYFKNSEMFLFSSEIRSLLASGLIPRKLNNSSLTDYITYGCVHGVNTMVEGIQSLGPGEFALLANNTLKIKSFWKLDNRKCSVYDRSYEEVTSRIKDLLYGAIEKRLVSDVPIGAFLSGGIDSSAVVAIMSQLTEDKVRTFSLVFDDPNFDESEYSDLISKQYKTIHTKLKLKPDEFLLMLPRFLGQMDSPSSDGLNSFVVSNLTKESGISVALSGLGADELFAGYPHFYHLKKLDRLKGLLRFSARFRLGIPKNIFKSHRRSSKGKILSRVFKLGRFDIQEIYPMLRHLNSEKTASRLLTNYTKSNNGVYRTLKQMENMTEFSVSSQISMAELGTYTLNTLLRDADQASMASALEVRVPFLDHELVEFMLNIGDTYKFSHRPKSLLVNAIDGLLPEKIINRPKMGFNFPWAKWIRVELREFCETRIIRLSNRSQFNSEEVNNYWKQFVSGDDSISPLGIWSLVVLEEWLSKNDIL